MFNLAPMGMGRASFRLAEIIQTGRIPIYLYGDYPWLPYHQTGHISPSSLSSSYFLQQSSSISYVQYHVISTYHAISCQTFISYDIVPYKII